MGIRWRKIRALAERLLAEHEIFSPPVPVEQIAKANHARLHLQALDGDISGFALRGEGQSVIGVNTRHAPVRQRFTIAHELGHLLLHDPGVRVDRSFRVRLRSPVSSEGTDAEEVEANRFAAEILMPVEFLKRDLEALDSIDLLDDEIIADLAKKYDVSRQAFLIRLNVLGYVQHA